MTRLLQRMKPRGPGLHRLWLFKYLAAAAATFRDARQAEAYSTKHDPEPRAAEMQRQPSDGLRPLMLCGRVGRRWMNQGAGPR